MFGIEQITRRCLMTLSDGSKIQATITIPKPTKPIFPEQMEREFIKNINNSLHLAKNKVMKKCYYYVATIFDSNPSGVIDGVLSTKYEHFPVAEQYCDQCYNPNWQPKSFEEFVKLGNICREAIKELSKSDWISVEDEPAPRLEWDGSWNDIVVCYKDKWVLPLSYVVRNDVEFTHWRRIEKLEE